MEQTTANPVILDNENSIEEHMNPRAGRHNKAKVIAVMSIAVVLSSLGDISLSKGMKMVGATEHHSLLDGFLYAVTNPYVLGGVWLMIAFLFLYLASLSWEDLSFVLPLTAIDYVLVTLLAFFVLGEPVSPFRWAGSVLVATGVALVAKS